MPWCHSLTMQSSGQKPLGNRPVRVKLGGTVLALARLENGRQVHTRLHQISITGGLLNLERPLDEGILFEVIFHLCTTTIRSQARALFPMWATQGYLQPFEFQKLEEKDRSQLQADLDGLLQASAATVVLSEAPFAGTPSNS
jgi:hypothetical protein